MPTPRGVYGRLPREDKRTIVLYTWMTLITVVLVVLFWAGRDRQGEETANRAKSILHSAVLYNCEETNTRNRRAKAQIRASNPDAAEKRAIVDQLQPPRDCRIYVYDRDHGLRYEASDALESRP